MGTMHWYNPRCSCGWRYVAAHNYLVGLSDAREVWNREHLSKVNFPKVSLTLKQILLLLYLITTREKLHAFNAAVHINDFIASHWNFMIDLKWKDKKKQLLIAPEIVEPLIKSTLIAYHYSGSFHNWYMVTNLAKRYLRLGGKK